MPRSRKPLVLIVDDEPGILQSLAGVLQDEGYRTLASESGEKAIELYRKRRPEVVMLDIWLPDRDGLEVLQALREEDPAAAVVMMSGHGTTSTAVKAIKMGACDFIEKPLSYNQAVDAVADALEYRNSGSEGRELLEAMERARDRSPKERTFELPPLLPLVEVSREPQRTVRESRVLYGLGLHSGSRTGMVLQPLPPDSGIHFLTLPGDVQIPAHVGAVAETDYATTLSAEGESVKTVEHLLSALHAAGVTNLLVKVHGEIPVLDGSALEFCRTLEEIGLEEQEAPRREIVIDRRYEVSGPDGKLLSIEPYNGFAVSYHLRYPPPIGDQTFEFDMTGVAVYKDQIAPARTFGFMKDLAMMAELGLATGGRLDNCILVGEDNVLNTELRFSDEFVRHKILDIVGDLYLLGYPIRGRVTAQFTGHRFNILLLRKILEEHGL